MTTSTKIRIFIGYVIVTATAVFLARYYPWANDAYTALIVLPLLYPVFLLGRLMKAGVARFGQPKSKPRTLDFTNRG